MSQQALIDKIIKAAEKEAEEITNEILARAADNEKLSLSKAESDCAAIKKAAEEKCAQIKRTSELTSSLTARKAKLHARRQLLDEAFGKSYKKMTGADGETRLEFVKKLIAKYAPDAEINAVVSDNDVSAVSAAKADIEKALSEKFGKAAAVTVSSDKNIKGGVYMKAALCDVDCTLDAVFIELREKYEAEADKILFSASQG